MATKAQQFRSEEIRKGPRNTRAAPKPRLERPGEASRASWNEHMSDKGDRKATVVIEESAGGGRPSRKSSRASVYRRKGASVLDRVQQMKSATAESRHGRRGG